MKRGKTRGKNYFVFIFILLFIIGVLAVGYFTGFLGKITGVPTKNVGINVTIGAPLIVEVRNGSATMTLFQGPLVTSRIINFTVYHGAGSQYINDSTARMNLTLVGGVSEVVRNQSGTNCSRIASTANNVTYSCNMTMFWYDGAGDWNVTASITDNNSNMVVNSSTTLYVGSLQGFEIAPTNLSWASVGIGATNQTSANDPLNLTNTGNQVVGNATGTSNISMNATDLKGEVNNIYSLFANNFSYSQSSGVLECGGNSPYNFSRNMYANMAGSVLSKGNYTIGDATTGRHQLYFCLRIAGAEILAQAYSTVNMTPWTIKIY